MTVGRRPTLLRLIATSAHARGVGVVVSLEALLLGGLSLLGGVRRLLIRLPLPDRPRRHSDSSANGRALPGIATDGSADRADRGTPGTAADRSARLRWRRRHLGRLRRVHSSLALRPVVALELIFLELVLALPLLRIH